MTQQHVTLSFQRDTVVPGHAVSTGLWSGFLEVGGYAEPEQCHAATASSARPRPVQPDTCCLHLEVEDVSCAGAWMRSRACMVSRIPGLTGVWVDGKKVAAIGVRAQRWVTYHGLAINLAN